MPREKQERELHLKPKSKYFGPKDCESCEDLILLHEEIEAVHLMDLLQMYQEDAAKKMNVSRATFARIIKSARKKIALALVSGHNLKIHEKKNEFYVAVCTDSKDEISNLALADPYIFIVHIEDYKVKSHFLIQNPIHENNFRPSAILPDLLLEYNVNYFITRKIGLGIKNTLLSRGIYPIIKDELQMDELIELFK